METDLQKSVLTARDSWSDLFPDGVVLWREVHFDIKGEKYRAELADVDFEKTHMGHWLCRIQIPGEYLYEPEVCSNKNGLVVFADREPPKDWTHLVVSGRGKTIQNPGVPGPGTCIFAKVAEPFPLADYMDFRKKLFKLCWRIDHGKLEGSFDNILDQCDKVWLPDFRGNEQRLILRRNEDRENLMDYCHAGPPTDDAEGSGDDDEVFEEIA